MVRFRWGFSNQLGLAQFKKGALDVPGCSLICIPSMNVTTHNTPPISCQVQEREFLHGQLAGIPDGVVLVELPCQTHDAASVKPLGTEPCVKQGSVGLHGVLLDHWLEGMGGGGMCHSPLRSHPLTPPLALAHSGLSV